MTTSNTDTDLIHYRLTQVEDKVEKIDDKLGGVTINMEVMKNELSTASGKTSTIVSSIVSIMVSVVAGFIMLNLGAK
jgi:archaellum component FlaC